MSKEQILADLKTSVETWNIKLAQDATNAAIAEGISIGDIIGDGLGKGMEVVGERFDKAEIFLPQVVAASKTMEAALKILEPLMSKGEGALKGTVVMATVEGDIHEIGKNVCCAMLRGAGYNVIDLGCDVTAQDFIDAGDENEAQVLGGSALMTTTLEAQRELVEAVKEVEAPLQVHLRRRPLQPGLVRRDRSRRILRDRQRDHHPGRQTRFLKSDNQHKVNKMAATRALTIPDVYDRFVKGKKVKVEDWDYKVIPENLTALKEKYNIKIDPNTIIPEDKELINNLFQAGLEMLVTTGYYCQDLGRVMHVTEEEVWEGIKKTPTKLILGEGKDIARFYPRHGNSPVKPIIQGGPTGSPISEDVFVQIMQSYAQEGIVDDLVNGVMTTIEGHPAKSKTPYEIRATMAELRATKEARVRAGRPGLGV